MVFIDSTTKTVLYYAVVSHETNAVYKQGIEHITSLGVDIQSITCDGRRGLNKLFLDVPLQMCQLHQIQIVTRYLTRRPKNIASIELRQLSLNLKQYNQAEFVDRWYLVHKTYLDERSINVDTGKTWYTHKRLRSAYRNLRTNSDWLFTYKEYRITYKEYQNLDIPNTTNSLEGLFSELNRLSHSHNGLNEHRKLRFIKDFLLSR